jgi:hypothetical protein
MRPDPHNRLLRGTIENALLLFLVVTSTVWYDAYWNPVTRITGDYLGAYLIGV